MVSWQLWSVVSSTLIDCVRLVAAGPSLVGWVNRGASPWDAENKTISAALSDSPSKEESPELTGISALDSELVSQSESEEPWSPNFIALVFVRVSWLENEPSCRGQ